MGTTSRRKRPLDRKIPHHRDSSLVVIATEGEITEKRYFELFQLKSSRVQVLVLGTTEGQSAPKHVFARLRQFQDSFALRKSDILCLAIDFDRWGDEQISKIAAESWRRKYLLAISRPCFEVWLLLHHADADDELASASSKEVKARLRSLLGGYDPSNLQNALFEPHIDAAVQRARALDTRPDDRWPQRLGTRVYRVIETIRERA